MPTKRNVISQALSELSVKQIGQEAEAEYYSDAVPVLDGLFAELGRQGFGFTWGLDETPEWALIPLAQLLARDLAGRYNVPYPQDRWFKAMPRLRAHAFPDDRADWRDTDKDGTVSDDEASAAKRALYY